METPNEAAYLKEYGATLTIRGVPERVEFGVDFTSYAADEEFRGIKMIPPGPHYVYAESNRNRVGLFHYFVPKDVLTVEWDNENGLLLVQAKGSGDEEITRIQNDLNEIDSLLKPYHRKIKKWMDLTDFITEPVINRCMPECGLVRPIVECESPVTVEIAFQKADYEPGFTPQVPAERIPRFTELPERYPEIIIPKRNNKDCIISVEKLMEKFESYQDLLGEIQFSFALYVIGNSNKALIHWRRILAILSNSESAITKYNSFYKQFLRILQCQLPILPSKLMESTEDNMVYQDVRQLVKNCSLDNMDDEVEEAMKNFEEELSWDLESDLDSIPELEDADSNDD